MKILMILFFNLIICMEVYPQWQWLNPLPQGNGIYAVQLIDSSFAVAVAPYGAFIKTTNGGINWSLKYTGTNYTLFGVHFTNRNNGVAVGGNGTISRTSDSGETWELYNSGTSSAFYDVKFADENNGFCIGENGLIYKTTDGGLTWYAINSGVTYRLLKMHAIDAENFVIISHHHILKTSDGGVSWIEYYTPLYLSDVFFTDHFNGTVVGWYGTVLKTTDGGNSWLTQNLGDPSLWQVYFSDYSNGLILGKNPHSAISTFFVTSDAGQNWIELDNSSVKGRMTRMSFIDKNRGIIAGDEGYISHTFNGGNTWITYMERLTMNFNSISFTDYNNGIAVSSSSVMKTNDGGINWTVLPLDIQGNVKFLDDETGYVFGSSGKIFKTTDMGASWQLIITGITEFITDISFYDQMNGIFLSSNFELERNSVYKTTDGGFSWNIVLEINLAHLQKIHYADSMNIIAFGIEVISKTSDGGQSWQHKFYPGFEFYCVAFADQMKGIAAGFPGVILITSDGGSNWTEIQSGSYFYFREISFNDNHNGVIVSSSGDVLRTSDGGANWYTDTKIPVTNQGIRTISYKNNKLVAGGRWGTLLMMDYSIIPVELSSLNAEVVNSSVILTWTTSSELNNRGFEIMRSLNEMNYYTIGYLPGSGTTMEETQYSFRDNLTEKGRYLYKLKQIDYNGDFDYSAIVEIDFKGIPLYSLKQNYPNPFNPSTTFKYSLAHTGRISLSIYDLLGRELIKLLDEEKPEGEYEVTWNASSFPTGVYFLKMQAGMFSETRKIMLMK